MSDPEQWVIWNGSLGVLDLATLGEITDGDGGRRACLAPPYAAVGPFSLDELEAQGRIGFGACLVMSRQRWQQDQVELRIDANRQRRAMRPGPDRSADDSAHRAALQLPLDGALKPSKINAAFRRLAKTAHPDAGGSDAHYRRITTARDALLGAFERAT
jgi:hypothetical protein